MESSLEYPGRVLFSIFVWIYPHEKWNLTKKKKELANMMMNKSALEAS